MSGIWQSFRKAGRENQAELTDHTFSFHIDDIDTGWEYVHFVFDGEGFGFRISYIGPDVSDLAEAMSSLKEKESKIFTWYDEPGEYNRFVSRLKNTVYIEAPYEKKGAF